MNAVITGATKGIGRAVAEQLALQGYDLYICSRHDADLQETKTALEKHSISCYTCVADLAVRDDIDRFVADVNSQWDHLDVLVNNAGVYLPGKVTEEEDGTLEKMLHVNLLSGYYITRGLLAALKSADRGYIFNMCSIASILSLPGGGSYSVSKFAQLGWTKVLRDELKDTRIAVTAIMPGATWSASWDGVDLPEERLMQPTDIAECISAALRMTPSAVMEEIIVRPQLGDL